MVLDVVDRPGPIWGIVKHFQWLACLLLRFTSNKVFTSYIYIFEVICIYLLRSAIPYLKLGSRSLGTMAHYSDLMNSCEWENGEKRINETSPSFGSLSTRPCSYAFEYRAASFGGKPTFDVVASCKLPFCIGLYGLPNRTAAYNWPITSFYLILNCISGTDDRDQWRWRSYRPYLPLHNRGRAENRCRSNGKYAWHKSSSFIRDHGYVFCRYTRILLRCLTVKR